MKTIKTRNTVKDIKILDKSADLSMCSKDAIIRTKECAEETQNQRHPSHASPTNYAVNNIQDKSIGSALGVVYAMQGARIETPAQNVKSTTKGLKKTSKGTVKTAEKSIKTAKKTVDNTVKTVQQTAKAAHQAASVSARAANAEKAAKVAKAVKASKAAKASKAVKAAEKSVRIASKAAAESAKAATKAITSMVKIAIAAIKGLIALLAAGGWIAIAVVIIISLVAMLVGSIFGIFFSSEPGDNGMTINSVIADIDAEYTDKINEIINSNDHDTLVMSGTLASWKEMLSVYTVKTVADPDNPIEVATMDDKKAVILNKVFWDMNNINYWIQVKTHTSTSTDAKGNTVTHTTYEYILHINITHKTPSDMAMLYKFNDEQNESLDELLKPEYESLWNMLLYGISSICGGSLIDVAITQLGNIDGEPYWRWYGFTSRVEWCACFVSWCAEPMYNEE